MTVADGGLLVWLLLGGAGALSVDAMLRRGLSRAPLFILPALNRLYARCDTLGAVLLPAGTRIYVACAIVGESQMALWRAPLTEQLITAPWWLLLTAWTIVLGFATRPVALVLCFLMLSITPPVGKSITIEITLLLALLATNGAGWLSLDDIGARWFARSMVPHPSDRPVPRVVVVGGGFGGIAVVHALRRTVCRITLIDRRNYHLFQPLLYQVATAALSPADIALPIRTMFRDQRNVSVRLGEVIGVDHTARDVLLADGRIAFDYLVLATGARQSYFGHEEWAPLAPSLKSIEDATTLRSRTLFAFERAESETDPVLRVAWLTFVVVGGGPAGVELAGALAELARTGLAREYRAIDPATARVILIQSAARVLPAFAPSLSLEAERSLRNLGVDVRTSTKVIRIDHDGVDVERERICARTTFWTAGIAASSAADWLGQIGDSAGRIIVAADLSVSNCRGVFAIGDTAACNGWAGKIVPGLAPAAKQQGSYVAKVIRAAIEGQSTPAAFRYRHRGDLATIGRLAAVVELHRIRLWGAPAWWLWSMAHVLLLAGGRNRATVTLNWCWAYVTYGRGTRLITRGSTMT